MDFDNYYKEYSKLHTRRANRYLHLVGNVVTLGFILFILQSSASLWWLLLSPLVVYPFAWSGHFFFGKNKPAAVSNPIKAKMADWKMMWDMIRGRM